MKRDSISQAYSQDFGKAARVHQQRLGTLYAKLTLFSALVWFPFVLCPS